VLITLKKAITVLPTSCFAASPVFAACPVVPPTGSDLKTGADWNNAYAGRPATLIRGNAHYLADRVYTGYWANTPNSETTTIGIRNAQNYDNCVSAGWNTTTMVSGQAIFRYTSLEPLIKINTSYWIFNGNGSSTAPGCGGAPGSSIAASPPMTMDCGIKLDNSTCPSGTTDACDNVIKINAANVTTSDSGSSCPVIIFRP
jgi:hypothetical protein